jgi:hypothetical protein
VWKEGRLYHIAYCLLNRCDAVLRLPGASEGADEGMRIATERGLPVFEDLADVPGCDQSLEFNYSGRQVSN